MGFALIQALPLPRHPVADTEARRQRPHPLQKQGQIYFARFSVQRRPGNTAIRMPRIAISRDFTCPKPATPFIGTTHKSIGGDP